MTITEPGGAQVRKSRRNRSRSIPRFRAAAVGPRSEGGQSAYVYYRARNPYTCRSRLGRAYAASTRPARGRLPRRRDPDLWSFPDGPPAFLQALSVIAWIVCLFPRWTISRGCCCRWRRPDSFGQTNWTCSWSCCRCCGCGTSSSSSRFLGKTRSTRRLGAFERLLGSCVVVVELRSASRGVSPPGGVSAAGRVAA